MRRGKPATGGQLSLFDAPARPEAPQPPTPGTSTPASGTSTPAPADTAENTGTLGSAPKPPVAQATPPRGTPPGTPGISAPAPGTSPPMSGTSTPAPADTAENTGTLGSAPKPPVAQATPPRGTPGNATDDDVPAWLSAPDWAAPPEEYPMSAPADWEEIGWEEWREAPPVDDHAAHAARAHARAACSTAHTPDAAHSPDPCPPAWRAFVPELAAGAHLPLLKRVAALRARQTIYPAQANIFAALQAAAPEAVRVIILGQDPYHGPGQAHGLCFSVQPPCPAPPSLVNIFKEIQADVYNGAPLPDPSACLTRWAQQGVLLLNTILSVQAGRALSHANLGWQAITRGILTALAAHHPLAVLLWGRPAQDAAAGLFRSPPHLVLRAPHPSPLSAHRGFFGCRHFSRTNHWLEGQGLAPIRW